MKLVELGSKTISGHSTLVQGCSSSPNGGFVVRMESGLLVHQPLWSISTSPPVPDSSSSRKHNLPKFKSDFIPLTTQWPARRSGQRILEELTLPALEVVRLTTQLTLPPKTEQDTQVDPKFLNQSRGLSNMERGMGMQQPITASWSPPGLLTANTSALSVLSANGDVNIIQYQNDWTTTHNISDLIYNRLNTEDKLRDATEDYTRSILLNEEMIITTAICWENRVYKNGDRVHTHFVTAQKNGDIYMWSVSNRLKWKSHLRFELYRTIYSNLKHMSIVYIADTPDPILLCGNNNGLIERIRFKVDEDQRLKYVNRSVLWPDNDKMVTTGLFLISSGETIRVAIVKQTYFIVIEFNKSGSVIKTAVENLASLNITGIHHSDKNKFIITTLNGSLFKLSVSEDSVIFCEPVENNMDLVNWVPYGLYGSPNNAIFVLCCNPVSQSHRTGAVRLIYCYDQSLNYVDMLLNNKSNCLTNYWDCFEILNTFPQSFPKQDSEGAYELKLRMWMNISQTKDIDIYNSNIFHLIIFYHAMDSLRKYLDVDVRSLSEFQLKSIASYVKYLENFQYDGVSAEDVVAKSVLAFGDVMPVVDNECLWCGEKIMLIQCSERHARQWCCVTLQDIETSDCLVCLVCKSVAHPSLLKESPKCTFCDSYMVRNSCNKYEDEPY